MNLKSFFKYGPRLIVAIIFIQTLFFKFGIGGAEALMESQKLFSYLTLSLFGSSELEAYFRIGTGIFELIASILILIPSAAISGALLGIGLMCGAILSHIMFIGVSIDGDGGTLMILAVIVLLCCVKVLFDEKEKVLSMLDKTTSQ